MIRGAIELPDLVIMGKREDDRPTGPSVEGEPPGLSGATSSRAFQAGGGPDTSAEATTAIPPERLTAQRRVADRYVILETLGTGGFGAVYRARDEILDRIIAVKVARPRVDDPSAVERFEREARATARLEHPHAVRLYDAGRDEKSLFLVLELVGGESLQGRLRHGPLPPALVATWGCQIASALAAAHAMGIVHRDIKPANLLLSADEQVKVADFGVARLLGEERLTSEGFIVGTPDYMAPEQIEGGEVGPAADLFSLGVVLYEMLTGHRPFGRGTTSEILARIVRAEVPPFPSEIRVREPDLCEAILAPLAKKPEARPSASQFASTLGSLPRASAFSADRPRPQGPRPWRLEPGTRLALGVALAGALGLVIALGPRLPSVTKAPVSRHIERLTERGTVWQAALSRSGRYLAYLSDGLWVKDLRENAEARITLTADGSPARLVGLSSDGGYIYFSRDPPEKGAAELLRVPVFGGTPQLLAEGDSFVLSPDGNRVLFRSERGLFVVGADGTARFQIATGGETAAPWWPMIWSSDSKRVLALKGGSLYELDPAGQSEQKRADLAGLPTDDPVMSLQPTGDILALGVKKTGTPVAFLQAVNLRDGTRRAIGDGNWRRIGRLAWLPDGRTLVVDGCPESSKFSFSQIWLVSYPDGVKTAIAGQYSLQGITADGAGLLVSQPTSRSEIRVSDNLSTFKRISTATASLSISWTAGGEIVYSSKEGENFNVYVLSPETQARRQLTFDQSGGGLDPAASPDGRYVVFVRTGLEGSLWRVGMDGTGLLKIVTLPPGHHLWMRPQVSPDSQWVLYFDMAGAAGGPRLMRVPIQGGAPLTIKGSNEGDPRPWERGFCGGWSHRGSEVAFLYFTNPKEGGQTPVELAIGSLQGTITRRFPYTPLSHDFSWQHQKVQWSAEGPDRYLYFLRDGQVWMQPVVGGAQKQVTHFDDEVFDFDWSRDGTSLAVSVDQGQSDVALITGFR
jgi:Tol biopolymer transport system component